MNSVVLQTSEMIKEREWCQKDSTEGKVVALHVASFN